MKKLFIILILTAFTSAHAGGHITKKQKAETIQCLGHYVQQPADTITDMEMALKNKIFL